MDVYRSLTFALCLLAASFPLSFAQNSCDPAVQGPLSIPVRNVTLQTPVIRRGIALSVGTPPQAFALAADATANNTYLFDESGLCDASTSSITCLGRNGGAFIESSSSTWQVLNIATQDNTKDPQFNVTADILGTDTLILNSSTSINQFPFHVSRNRNVDMNTVGLGPNSSLLNALRNAGIIASRSWSLFWGLTGDDPSHQMDGSLVIGGFDAAKVQGNNLTQPLQPNEDCPSNMVVTVTSIEMLPPSGNSIELLGTQLGSSLRMCIEPNYELITIPDSVWQIFQENAPGRYETRSLGINLWGMDYDTAGVYAGDLKFVLSGELSITIPNEQLVQRDISVDPSGNIVFNESIREIMLNPLEQSNKNDMPILGMTFLQAAYLSVNYDENTFTLWSANPTTDEILVGIGSSTIGCARNISSTSSSSSATSSSVDSQASNGASTESTKSHGSSLSKGVIAAIVLAVVCAVVIGCVLVWLFVKRRNTPLSPHFTKFQEPSTDTTPWSGGQSSFYKPELPGSDFLSPKSNLTNYEKAREIRSTPQEMP